MTKLFSWLVVSALLASPAFGELIWIEAEVAPATKIAPDPAANEVDVDELSGGAWLSSLSTGGQPAAIATYTVNLAEPKTMDLWVRANPRGTGLAYRSGTGRWVAIEPQELEEQDRKSQTSKRYLDARPVSIDGAAGKLELVWMNVGKLRLSRGSTRIDFLLGSDASSVKPTMFAAIDAFVLTDDQSFQPHARFRPGETWPAISQLAPEEVWDFQPPSDELDPAALVDLRHLNEVPAGRSGFVRLSDDGMSFVRGDGVPLRFWGGSDYNQRDLKLNRLVRHANFLAKRGVNLVRWHGSLAPVEPPGGVMPLITSVNEQELDEAFKLVAAMKRAGIYTILSPYWGSHTKALPSWGLADNDNLAALVFFDPKVQGAYKAWLRELYTRPNPYTGIPLKDEPAVAMAQIQNEDSMLFWTMQRVKGEPLMLLRQQFARWLVDKHGSFDAALKSWSNYAHPDDDAENGLPGLFIVWEFTQAARDEKGGVAGREARLADQLQFMAEVQYSWNREVARFLREDLGAQQLINAGNWRTVDVLTEDAERWSYTANEVIGKNHYYGGHHQGLNVGWQIRQHHYFTSPSATREPDQLPLNVKQVAGHPFIIPESLWVPPTLYQSEGPLMVAAQSSLTGVDAFMWFANGVPEWQPPGNKWTYATPMQLGQFPATALMHRMGYLTEATPVVVESRALADVWARKSPAIAEGRAYDPNRDTGNKPTDTPPTGEIDPLAFVAGPVHLRFTDEQSSTQVADLSQSIQRSNSLVSSVTGQITTDFGKGLYTVNAPKTQAVAGFLKAAGTLELDDLRITCDNEYATIVAISLDDRPLNQSEKILLQVGTVCRAAGWKARRARFSASGQLVEGFRILDPGAGHWQVEKTHATLSLRNTSITRAVALDANMMPLAEVPLTRDAQRVDLQLPQDSMYTVLLR